MGLQVEFCSQLMSTGLTSSEDPTKTPGPASEVAPSTVLPEGLSNSSHVMDLLPLGVRTLSRLCSQD